MSKSFRAIKGKKVKIAVFDIESRNWIDPYGLGFFDGETYKEFLGSKCVNDFLKFVLKKKYRGYTIFAHNGGRFDFSFIFETIKEMGFKIDLIFQGSRCLLIKVYLNLYTDENDNITHSTIIKFSDSFSLLKFSLDKLTKSFNVEHKKINFMDKKKQERDYEYLYNLYKNKDDRFHTYLKNDVLGLYEVLMEFSKLIENNNGEMSLTIASTSLKTFQKGYLKNKLVMSSKKINDEMKNGYYGGKTEIFKMFIDEGKYKCYDVNSLYPSVMFDNDFPCSRPYVLHDPRIKDIKEKTGITQAKVITPTYMYYPLLPYKYNTGSYNKLIFPLGKFTGYWDNHLLRKAIDLGYKVKPIKMFSFNTEYIFKDYIHTFYNIKQKSEKDTPSYILAKLLMNSLYGKFAQSQDSEKLMQIKSIKDMIELKDEIIDVFDPDNNVYRVKCESNGNFFIPQISIHVTALALLRLYSFIEYLHNKGNIVSYCDTDSLFTNGTLHTSNKLGDMKKEYDFFKGYFLLPKTYCIVQNNGNKIKAKGYIGEFQKQLSENSFKKALFKNDYSDFQIISKEETINTMKTSYIRHKTYLSTDYIKKSIHATYDKRAILKDYDTKPLVINE